MFVVAQAVDRLVADVGALMSVLFSENSPITLTATATTTATATAAATANGVGVVPIVMCGHSMGGTVAIRFAAAVEAGEAALLPQMCQLKALAVVDAVEGAALAAMERMEQVL